MQRGWINGLRMLVGVCVPLYFEWWVVDGSVGVFGEDFEDWVSEVAEYGPGGGCGEYGGCERGIRWTRSCLNVAEYCKCPAISMRYSKLNVKTLERSSDSINLGYYKITKKGLSCNVVNSTTTSEITLTSKRPKITIFEISEVDSTWR